MVTVTPFGNVIAFLPMRDIILLPIFDVQLPIHFFASIPFEQLAISTVNKSGPTILRPCFPCALPFHSSNPLKWRQYSRHSLPAPSGFHLSLHTHAGLDATLFPDVLSRTYPVRHSEGKCESSASDLRP